ncbi:MAG: polyprenyl synthetase family protein [Candidatus Riflebacteria bacterium]|nr:polyprenyl synthetase family protein [Candidatus Riflebacteria bacterium]
MNKQSQQTGVFDPIAKELDLVEKTWHVCFRKATSRSLHKINGFFRNSTGKRLRPALTILSAGTVLGKKPTKIQTHLVNIAAAIELLHTASLIHDDTIDAALTRHNKPTINSKFGSHISIAFGDYVYSLALKLISTVSDPIIFDCFAQRTFDCCEGELIQIFERKNLEMTPSRYFSIVRKKTAALFALSGEAGALLADSGNLESAKAMREFGLNFGMAYQIIDDMRDLVADKVMLGKDPGADFQVAELTLPMIYLLKDAKVGGEVKRLFSMPDKEKCFEQIRQIAVGSEALRKTRTKAESYLYKTKQCVASFPDSLYKKQLLALTDWLAEKM